MVVDGMDYPEMAGQLVSDGQRTPVSPRMHNLMLVSRSLPTTTAVLSCEDRQVEALYLFRGAFR
jgi:hypothetical protein